MMFKNFAGQKIAVFAFDNANSVPKTGDEGNITAQISKDAGATAATNDVNPTELDATDAPGIYIFDATQAESFADLVILCAVSSTPDITLEPVIIYTTPPSGRVVIAGTVSTAVGAPTTINFWSDDITEATTGHYNGRIILFTSGALINQAKDITAYSLDTGEGKFTVTALTEAPANNDTFVIV